MTIHIRQFSVNDAKVLEKLRELGNTDLTDSQGNKLCTLGNPENYMPCFEKCNEQGEKSTPMKVAQLASWPLAFQGMKQRGKNSRPPSGCDECCPGNAHKCLEEESCIFSVCTSKLIRPQFVFLGKNWSADIVNHEVIRTCWGNGNNVQAAKLRGTIFEGGYFTDFVKGLTATDFNMAQWLSKGSDRRFCGRKRFDVFLEIFINELKLLSSFFDLRGADKYIVIWGVNIFNDLNTLSQINMGHDFANLPFFKDNGYNVRLFGAHYTPQGKVLDTLRGGPTPELNTIRRIYKTAQERTLDNKDDQRRFDFEIKDDLTAPPKAIKWLP